MGDHQRHTAAHRLLLEGAEASVVGWWDPARLERVLANLVSNAIKYSPAGGAILVQVWQEEDPNGAWAVLSVQDHGVGIPAADLPHLFERFWRGSNVVSWITGTGIGLSSARQIVEAHGGAITVQSAEGVGSTFTLRLPLASADPTSPAA